MMRVLLRLPNQSSNTADPDPGVILLRLFDFIVQLDKTSRSDMLKVDWRSL
jgi:hypothetical protein